MRPPRGGAGGMNSAANTMRERFNAASDPASQALSRCDRLGLPVEWVDTLYDWVGQLRLVQNLSVNTAANYVRWVREWMVFLREQDLTLEGATPDTVISWQRELALKHRVGANTSALALSAIRQFYGWREVKGLAGNPAANVKGPKKPRRQPRKFSADQLTRLFAGPNREKPIGVRDFALLLFFYATGARREELAGLTLHQLVLKRKTGAVRFHGKGNKERTLTFEGAVVDAMWHWLSEREKVALPGVDTVFVGLGGRSKGRPIAPNGINALMNRLCKRAKIQKQPDDPFGVHRLRSSFATDLYDQGKDIRTIQLLLGHDDINTTMMYIAITDRHMRERMPSARLDQLLGNEKKVPGYVEQKLRQRQPD